MCEADRPWETAPDPPEITRDEVHVWRIALDQPPAVVERLERSLTPDERARAVRFRFERDRSHFIVGRGALRAILGGYLGVEASRVEFRYEAYGKPALASGGMGLQFNLSHSKGLALLAVARDRPLGIDVEMVRDLSDFERIIERFFSARECAAFRALAEDQKLAAFFRCWTRKESYMKATGEGFSMPLDRFDVSLAPYEPARLLNVVGRPGEADRWTLRDLVAGPGYPAALMVEGSGWRVRCFEFNHELACPGEP